MAWYFVNSSAEAAWVAATSQQAQLEALVALWAGDLWAKFYTSGGTHLATVTYGTPTIDTGTTPRAMVLGAWSAESHIVNGTAAYCILQVPSGSDIIRADVTLAGAISDPGGRVRLDIGTTLRIEATASLPASGLPTWLAGRAVNEAFAISGTIHAGSAASPGEVAEIYCESTRRLSYSGIATDNGTQIIAACTGGHGDSSNNAVTSIDLSANAPAWELRKANYGTPVEDVAYYSTSPTVEPTSRHAYNTIQYSTTHSRLMLHTTTVSYGSAQTFATTNGFNLATNTFDASGTWADGYFVVCRDSSDNAWAVTGSSRQLRKWTAATDTWTLPGSFGDTVERQMAHDSVRDQLFGLSWGSGGGSETGLKCHVYRSGGTTQTTITLNPVGGSVYPAGNAVQQWEADAVAMWPTNTGSIVGGNDCAMDYDPITDRFYWTDGLSGRIYYIVPTTGTTWDFGILALTGTTLPPTDYSHTRMKILEIAGYPVLVEMPSGHQTLYAVRLA